MTTDELRALLQKASVLLEAAATVGISAQYENGNDTPNKRYCRETVNEIYAALSSDFAVVTPDVVLNAKRYEFLKTRIEVPGAAARFLCLNNWHPETNLRNVDEAIDKAMLAASEGK